ncbi:MAG TPA: DUF1572 family protein [Candidatus Sulfopaludibacter sp.]|jgi:uncharacterized damage-inducible protein DinB|nr:DUF1572 family protein [Candidatus Sulfopaludibacter sp.]
MDSSLEQAFLKYSSEKLTELTGRIETSLKLLSEDQIWARGSDNENAIGNLVLHLSGNVRQWIVAGVGNQPDVRERDKEFASRGGVGVDALIARLRGTVQEAVATIEPLTGSQLAELRSIQGYHGTVLEAIYHVVEHFSMHTGQILFATKMLTGADLGFYKHLSAAAVQK